MRGRSRGAGAAVDRVDVHPVDGVGLEVLRLAEARVEPDDDGRVASSRRPGRTRTGRAGAAVPAGRRPPRTPRAAHPRAADSPWSSAPPEHDHVPPSWAMPERNWSITCGPSTPSTTNSTPAAPNRPQRTCPSLQRMKPSPLPNISAWAPRLAELDAAGSSFVGGVIDNVRPSISSTISGWPLSLVIVTGLTDRLRIAMPPPYRRLPRRCRPGRTSTTRSGRLTE